MQEIVSKKSIGERLRSLRLSRDLSQAEVSTAFGLSRSHYSQVELGKQFPSYTVLSRIAEFYEKDYEWILHGASAAKIVSNVKSALKAEGALLASENEHQAYPDLHLSEAAAIGKTAFVKSNEYITYLERRQDAAYVAELPEVMLPCTQLVQGNYRAFEIDNDRMESALNYQDVAIGLLVEDHLKVSFSTAYVIVLKNEVIVRRIVNFNLCDAAFICVSDNKKYGLDIIYVSDIKELWEIKAKISFHVTQTIQSISQYFQDFEVSMHQLREEVNRLKSDSI